jgi:ribosome-binding factor A
VSERTARLDELLREEISGIIGRDVQDPRIGFVTVTDVEVSPDLGHANVWVSVIGSAEERREALRGLTRAMPFVRRQLGRLRLKRIPVLHVRDDRTSERGTRILTLLREIESGRDPAELDTNETLPSPTDARGRAAER